MWKKWDDIALSYRFTKVCVPAIRSRVYLYMGDWQNAYAQAEEALKTKNVLEDFKADGFKLPNQYQSVEAINALEYTINNNYQNAVSVLPSFLAMYQEATFARMLTLPKQTRTETVNRKKEEVQNSVVQYVQESYT